jgi:hypothetical protein
VSAARIIPPAVVTRGVEAFVRVLRRRHPDVGFVVREPVAKTEPETPPTARSLHPDRGSA